MAVVIVAALTGLLSFLLTRWLVQPEAPIRLLDRPNDRSLHVTPTPRSGGVAICASLLVSLSCAFMFVRSDIIPFQIVSGALIIACISILDDRYGLSQVLRLLVQFVASLLLIRGGFVIYGEILPDVEISSSVFATVATVIMSLWLTNLYNFMDGMDGFAGGMTLIGFGTLGLLGLMQGDLPYAGAALIVSASVAGFLWFNFPPARIFMGDTGSTTLGFIAAGFTIWGSRRGTVPVWLALVVFSPFVVDATVTLFRRVLSGEAIWQAHRSHYYQRLVQLGWGHRRTVLTEYAVMLICSVSALIMIGLDEIVQWFGLVMLVLGYFIAALGVHYMERKADA